MSYILDALRRADSERERGAVPSLHSKPVAAALADGDDDVEPRRASPLLWAVVGLSVVLVAVLAWQFLGGGPAEPVPAPASVSATAPAAPAPVAVVTPPQPEPIPAPIAMAPIQPLPQPTAQPMPRKPARAVPKAQATTASAVAAEGPVPGVNELPENIRRELPQLNVGGAMYSQTAANRMLILNGQVFHEGDKVSADLVLEQIKLKSAVLVYKSHRYGISY